MTPPKAKSPMRKDLNMVKLGEVCRVVGGGTPSKKNEEYYKGDIPWASVRDMNCQYLEKTEFKITQQAVDESATNIIPRGEIIIATHVGLGKVCVLCQDTAINQDLKAIIPLGEMYRKYLYFWFVAKAKVFIANGKGATVKGVTVDFVKDQEIPLPPLPEQKRIAEELDNICAAKKDAEAIVEKLKQLAKSRFVEMFGDPIANNHEYPVKLLGEVLLSIDSGKSFVCESAPRVGEHPAVLKLSAVSFNGYNPEENKSLLSADMFVAKAEVKDCDLLFTRKNTPELVGACAYVKSTPRHLMMPDLVFRLNPTDEVDKQYLCALINHPLVRPKIQNLSGGSAKSMSNISKERLSKLDVVVPPIELQKQYALFIEQLDKSVFEARELIGKLDLLYRAKLQEYFG